MDQFPGNSHNEKQKPGAPKAPAKKVERVVSGDVVRRKQPLSKRLKAHFMPQTDMTLSEHIFFEVFLPGATAAASEVFHQCIDIVLPVQSRNRGRGGPRPSYRAASSSRDTPAWLRGQEDPREAILNRRMRATHNFDLVVINDRAKAQEVLDELYNLLDQYDQVTVGDFYDCVGESHDFTDDNYGWTSLAGTRVIHRYGGYVIDLPPTETLKRR